MQKSSNVSGGVAKSEGSMVAPEVKKEHVLLMFLQVLKHENRDFAKIALRLIHLKQKKVARINISRFLAISAPKSLKIQVHLCVFCDFASFEEKVRNLKHSGRNINMYKLLFATLRFPVFGDG